MTSEPFIDIRKLLVAFNDLTSLELTRRVVQAELTFHEARVGQLRELDQALAGRANELSKG